MSYNFTSYELHFHLLPFAPYWVLFCAKTPNQKITKTSNTRRSSLQVSSLGFHRVASASLSSLVGNGYLQHDGPYRLGRSEPDRLISWWCFYTSSVIQDKQTSLLCWFVCFCFAALFSDALWVSPKNLRIFFPRIVFVLVLDFVFPQFVRSF